MEKVKTGIILFFIFIAPSVALGDTCYRSNELPILKVFAKVPNKSQVNSIRVQFTGMSKSVAFANETVAKYAFEIFKVNSLLPENKRKKYCVIYGKGKIEGVCLGKC